MGRKKPLSLTLRVGMKEAILVLLLCSICFSLTHVSAGNNITLHRNPWFQKSRTFTFLQRSSRGLFFPELNTLSLFKMYRSMKLNILGFFGSVTTWAKCKGCEELIRSVDSMLRWEKLSDKSLMIFFGYLCRSVISLFIKSEVCIGIINSVFPIVRFVRTHPSAITPMGLCKYVIVDPSCGGPKDSLPEWQVPVPNIAKPLSKLAETFPITSPTIKILHLSDLHIDPEYMENSSADCDKLPLCCRRENGPGKTEATSAGKWGGFGKCDLPPVTFKSLLQHAAHHHPTIGLILWAGDTLPHDIWKQSKESNLKILQESLRQIRSYFPDVPIFPTLGNHDTYPFNVFDPPELNISKSLSTRWLYKEVGKQWSKAFPAKLEQLFSITYAGYYATTFKNKLRIISINTNFCHTLNMFMWLKHKDPGKQLQWLASELQKAETLGQKVYILGHIPIASSDCLEPWSHNFHRIVNRYEETIQGMFFGHEHTESFQVFLDQEDPDRATVVSYIGPSGTPYEGAGNPAYRVYEVDGFSPSSSWRILNYETWVMDLDEEIVGPYWKKFSEAKADFGLRDLSQDAWKDYALKLTYDLNAFDQFYFLQGRRDKKRERCRNECRQEKLCSLFVPKLSFCG